jgi:hypothetical protein
MDIFNDPGIKTPDASEIFEPLDGADCKIEGFTSLIAPERVNRSTLLSKFQIARF